ncbi:MAG: glutaredoxin family protein [Pseudomonadales bacterium]|nr:glutaredoxin family protein [Pseudomonadales bacterium]
MFTRHIITLCFLLFAHNLVYAEIYSWVDDTGQRHYGDEKPKTQTSKEINIKPNISGYQMINPDLNSHTAKNSKPEKLVMYSTAWCGFCKKARAFFKANHIPFKERNIEKSRQAKAAYKKLGGKNVPFFAYKGYTHSGFSEYHFMKFYEPLLASSKN